eukprot:gene24600-10218_t
MHAVLGCLFSTVIYVGSLYIWRGPPRDHPVTIKRRMLSVTIASTLAWIPLLLTLPSGSKTSLFSFQAHLVELLGLRPPCCLKIVTYPLFLTATFFLGPIIFFLLMWYKTYIAKSGMKGLGTWFGEVQEAARDLLDIDSLVGWRNLVVAPITEEFVFRACMAPLLRLQGYGVLATVFVTPLFFGLAHLHHLHDRVHNQGFPLKSAIVNVGFQFTYTTIFGWYETYLFLSTGSLLAPVLVHSFANFLGVPPFGDMAHQLGPHRSLALTVLGVIMFIALFGPLTSAELYKSCYGTHTTAGVFL